jgi:anti-sigma regulatory factor (Ser/Thr protein kinase)
MALIEHALDVRDPSAVGHARRVALDIGRSLELADETLGRLGLVVTEAGTNLVKHAGGGELLVGARHGNRSRGVAVMALDRGPGLPSHTCAFRDGFSSSGTSGTGLGAIRRQSSAFDLFTAEGAGVALLALICDAPPAADGPLTVAGLNVPYPGEDCSGDAWSARTIDGRLYVLVADGLGHGLPAAEASSRAREVFDRCPDEHPAEMLQRVHDALRPTRGAAAAVTEIDPRADQVRFAGIGNVAGTIVTEGGTRSLVSHNGTLGHQLRRIQEFTYSWAPDSLLVLHTDGLGSRWRLDRYPGVLGRHPLLIAGLLYRDFKRGRDDVSIVVIRHDA